MKHPDFYWGATNDLIECKYLELRLDTRDNHAIIKDGNGKRISLEFLRNALEKVKTLPTKGMNENHEILADI